MSKTPGALLNQRLIQMLIRLSQANRKIPIMEEMISWSILKKKTNPKNKNLDVKRQMHR